MTYKFLDSGGGRRLEQFGETILARPSSLALWQVGATKLWDEAHAEYVPGEGWRGSLLKEWPVIIDGISLLVRPQDNGQVGVFPEHNAITAPLLASLGSGGTLLNLFAYTGLASLVAAKAGAEVTHVDSAKPALDWTRDNLARNNLSGVRLIPDDALVFLERDVRRGKKYRVVLADPPNFSRLGKKSWDLDQIAPQLLELIVKVAEPGGTIIFSSHHPALHAIAVLNLIASSGTATPDSVTAFPLILGADSARPLRLGEAAVVQLLSHAK